MATVEQPPAQRRSHAAGTDQSDLHRQGLIFNASPL
jgi:hypothetical protein